MLDYKFILFDLDGTLSDSAPGIINSVKYALESQGLPIPSEKQLRKFVGPPLYESFRDFCGQSLAESDVSVRLFRIYFRDRGIMENAMYAGVPEMLDALKRGGKKLALATSKPEEFARNIISRYGIGEYFDYLAGSTMDESRIKKADVVAYVMEILGAKPSECLMVGDRSHDVHGAAEHGMDCMGVLYGYGDEAELLGAGARYIAETVGDIARIILE